MSPESFQQGALHLCGGLGILKMYKIFTNLLCFLFQVVGAWSFVWGG